MAKIKPINAYPIANGLRFAGINMVNKPKAAADTNITRPTNLSPAWLFNLEFCHILPASASRVMPIIRIDQTI